MTNDKECPRCGSFGGYGCYKCIPDQAQAELQAAVVAEREACENIAKRFNDASRCMSCADTMHILEAIRARTDPDAQAALEARDKRVWDKALREAMRIADAVSKRGRHGHKDVPWAGWTTLEYKKYQWAAMDIKHGIENLMEDTDDD